MTRRHIHWCRIFGLSTFLLIVLLGILAAGGQKPEAARSVSIVLTVHDDLERPITGFTKEKISLTADSIPREIESLVKDDRPASIALVLDLSGMVSEQKRILTSNWLSQFISDSNRSNEYALIGYDTSSTKLCDWNCGNVDLRTALQSIPITPAKAGRKISTYDACVFALSQLNGRANAKRVILILSDGMDKGSKTSFGQVRTMIRQSGVLLYDVGIVSDAELPFWQPNSVDYVRELATISGGWVDRTSSVALDAERTAEILAGELRNQYLIRFKMPGAADHNLHPIRIKLIGPIPKPTPLTPAASLRYRQDFYDE
jgi:Ca-activated chloride channel family protein